MESEADKIEQVQADNNKGALISIDTVLQRAAALCAMVPERMKSEKTRTAYRKAFSRMAKSEDLDPLKDGIALDTYHYRRAVLHFGGQAILEKLIKKCLIAREQQDRATELDRAAEIFHTVSYLEPLFELEPPLPAGALPWERPASRWHQSLANAGRVRGANSKKHVLRYLPYDWDKRLWNEAPLDWPHREALAVHSVVPARPEELMPGDRPSGRSWGVVVELRSPNCLAITFAPVKSHHGLYGTELTEICVDPEILGGAAEFLAQRCAAANGQMVVSTKSKNAVHKAIVKLGEKALPEIDVTITASVLRHQLLADFKVMFGAGEAVAAAAGHCTDRTQAHYGPFQYGRKRKGYLNIKAQRSPRFGNTDRARNLAQGKKAREPK